MFEKIGNNETIDYGKFEKKVPEQRKEIKGATQIVSQEINDSLNEKLLSADGTVSRKSFAFSEEEFKQHKEFITKKEEKWIRKKYKLKNNQPISEKIRHDWEKKQDERKSELMEMSVMIILHKVLKDDYIICRANKYDDYHGVDNIIVHKKTGVVLCAFDDVKDQAGGVYEWQKEEYIDKFGSQTITYCPTFEDNKLVKKQINNIPKLYLSFDDKQFYKILNSLNCKNLNSVSDDEYDIYNYIIEALISQIGELKEKSGDNEELLKNIDKFEGLIPELRLKGNNSSY